MPSGGGNLAVAVYNGLIYTFGGSTYLPWSGFSDVYAYNPQTDKWTPKTKYANGKIWFASIFSIITKIYAIGGSQ